MLLSATGTEIGIEIATGTMIAIEIAVTTITTEFIGAGMETATTAGFIAIGMEIATEGTPGTGEMTAAMIEATAVTTGVGTGVAGFTGTAATGFTKKLTLALSESQRRNVHRRRSAFLCRKQFWTKTRAVSLPPPIV
jgi:hypothetical protein